MAFKRDHPFSQFNFRVSWDGLNEKQVEAGFQEVSGLGMEITVAEYRAGNHSDNSSIKVNGTYKIPDVTLKRGVIGSNDLYTWINQVRNGAPNHFKTVTIKLMAEDRETAVVQWKLTNARPMKYTGPSLNGKGTDLAIEELVLASERIERRAGRIDPDRRMVTELARLPGVVVRGAAAAAPGGAAAHGHRRLRRLRRRRAAARAGGDREPAALPRPLRRPTRAWRGTRDRGEIRSALPRPRRSRRSSPTAACAAGSVRVADDAPSADRAAPASSSPG